jgi:hypothetical protein
MSIITGCFFSSDFDDLSLRLSLGVIVNILYKIRIIGNFIKNEIDEKYCHKGLSSLSVPNKGLFFVIVTFYFK